MPATHPNQITAWKLQLCEGAVDMFDAGPKRRDEAQEVVKELQTKIDGLTMEKDL